MGGPGSGRRKGFSSGRKRRGMVKIKLKKNKKIGYKIDDIGAGGRVVRTTGWKF